MKIEKIVAFLETKDPTEKYEYMNQHSCAIAQFIEHDTGEWPTVTASNYREGSSQWARLPYDWDNAVRTQPWTFGAALHRFRALV